MRKRENECNKRDGGRELGHRQEFEASGRKCCSKSDTTKMGIGGNTVSR